MLDYKTCQVVVCIDNLNLCFPFEVGQKYVLDLLSVKISKEGYAYGDIYDFNSPHNKLGYFQISKFFRSYYR